MKTISGLLIATLIAGFCLARLAATWAGATPAVQAAVSWARAAVRSGSRTRWTYQPMPAKILVRFEYITDAAMNYESLMLDDISIPEINDTGKAKGL
jgi:hypothetical protein